ncbi:hypothetical protein B9479_007312, partial [Cryptococcus floricola]
MPAPTTTTDNNSHDQYAQQQQQSQLVPTEFIKNFYITQDGWSEIPSPTLTTALGAEGSTNGTRTARPAIRRQRTSIAYFAPPETDYDQDAPQIQTIHDVDFTSYSAEYVNATFNNDAITRTNTNTNSDNGNPNVDHDAGVSPSPELGQDSYKGRHVRPTQAEWDFMVMNPDEVGGAYENDRYGGVRRRG